MTGIGKFMSSVANTTLPDYQQASVAFSKRRGMGGVSARA